MNRKIIQFENKYILVNIIFNSLMLFSELLPTFAIMVVSCIFVIWSITNLHKKIGLYMSIIYTSIAMIPTSFISILGGSTGTFPLAWFHLLVILSVFLIFFKGKVDKLYFIYVAFFVVLGICGSLLQPSPIDGIKQVLMMLLCFFSFFIGDMCFKEADVMKYHFLYKLYISGTLSTAIQVFVQYIFVNSLDIEIGNVGYYANRVAYGGLMNDYSFATVYIATGFMAVMLAYFEYRTIDIKKFALLEVVLVLGIMIVSARTGLYALVISIVLYFITHLNRFRLRYMVMIIVAFFAVPLLIDILMSNRGGQNLLDDSGRMSGYIQAIEIYFNNNILFGVGFGLENLTNKYDIVVPHNFFVQYLLQGGLIGLTIIVAPFIRFVKKIIRKVDCSIWLFILIFISAMAIPDIMSSRFLYAVIILCQMSCVKKSKYL